MREDRNRSTPPSLAALVLLMAAAATAIADPQHQPWVRYPSSDGVELHARFFAASQTVPGVLLLHQCDREIDGVNRLTPLAEMLAAHGLRVLLPDLRGYGRNAGPAQDGSASRGEDALAGLRFLGASAPLAVLGASCSGRALADALRAGATIDATVLLSAALGDSHLQTLSEFGGPLLCVAARRDPFGRTFESTREACLLSDHPRSEAILVDGVEHGAPLLAAHRDLAAQVVEWLVRELSE